MKTLLNFPLNQPWRLLAVAIAIAASAGCGGSGGADSPGPVQKDVSLTSFSGPNACSELERYVEDTAVLDMRTQLEAARDGTPSWGWWPPMAPLGLQALPAPPAPTPAPPTEFTTTNNQVAGVDEADFVKNDGTRIFALAGNRLHALRSWPAAQMQRLDSLEIEGYPRELFLDGTQRAVVFSSVYDALAVPPILRPTCLGLDCGYWHANTVKVTEVDVSDMTNLRVIRAAYLPGSYVSARKVGSSVRIVLSDRFPFPVGIKWWPDWDPTLWQDAGRLAAAYDQLIADNEMLIRQRTLAEWLRPARIKVGAITTDEPHACGDFARVSAPTRLGVVTVATLELASGSMTRTSILGEEGEIYASPTNLYVATRHWWWRPEIGQENTTYIHKFDISQPSRANYVGSGGVAGHIVDPFSIDEAASGHLRVVTTVERRVPDPTNPQNTWGRIETVNRLSVLAAGGGRLRLIGQSPDLAQGERVTSSRIVGDKAFVATFRVIDPLFTLDLSNPAAPRVVGELKIPGFSTYMHPIDANHVLTIGTFIPEPLPGQPIDWRARALQLSIFDVSNLASPRQTHTQLVGTAYGWSEAQSEHRAFNYFTSRRLLAIPFSDWSTDSTRPDYWNEFISELRVFTVDPVTGFTPRGTVSMRDMYLAPGDSAWSYAWSPEVRRSVMADDFVYAISDAGVRVANITDLATPLVSVPFESPVP